MTDYSKTYFQMANSGSSNNYCGFNYSSSRSSYGKNYSNPSSSNSYTQLNQYLTN